MDEQQLKADVDAFVDEVWEDVVADIRTLVKIESVEDLEHAEPGKPWGPAANDALVAAEKIAFRLGLEVTDLDSTNGTIVANPGQQPVRLVSGQSYPVYPGGVVDLGDGQVIRVEPA